MKTIWGSKTEGNRLKESIQKLSAIFFVIQTIWFGQASQGVLLLQNDQSITDQQNNGSMLLLKKLINHLATDPPLSIFHQARYWLAVFAFEALSQAF